MITINYTIENGGVVLERPLTEEEQETVTSRALNGTQAIFYQNDEPTENFEPVKVREVANWKIKAILKTMGLMPSIDAALEQLEEPTRTVALYAWEYSSTIDMYSPTVAMIKQAIGLTDQQVKEIFDQADAINI